MERGADGLTEEELRAGRERWWDAAFTEALLAAIPKGSRLLVEVGCGLGRGACEILPRAGDLRYVGIDLDPARIAASRVALAKALASRAHLLVGRGEALPLAGRTTDVVLTMMTLMHVPDPQRVLSEAARLLRPGGVVVAAEPDNPGQRFYFDGFLEEVTRAFVEFWREARRSRLPADLAVGPRIASLMRDAGLVDVTARVHLIQKSECRPAEAWASVWRNLLSTLCAASGIDATSAIAGQCRQAIADWLASGDPNRLGHGGDCVPVFISVGKSA